MGEVFAEGAKIKIKPNLPVSEQGLFLSHEPLPRFVEVSAFGKGGEKPAFIIISSKTAEKAVPTGKIYRKTTEMESKLPVGAKVYAPKQRLYTRVGAEQNIVEIWLEKPLSKWQVARLKASGLHEAIKTILTPSIKIKRLPASLTIDEFDELAQIIGKTDSELAVRARRTIRVINEGRYASSATRSISRVGSKTTISRLRERYNVQPKREIVRIKGKRVVDKERVPRTEELARQDRLSREERLSRSERAIRQERIAREERLLREDRILREKERVPYREFSPRDTRILQEERLLREKVIPREKRLPRVPRLPRKERVLEKDRLLKIPKILPNGDIEVKDKGDKRLYPKGTVVWRMGKLHKNIWHILEPPYRQEEYSIAVSNKPPKGAKETTATKVAETIQEMGGRLGKDIVIDIGAFDMHLMRAKPKPITRFTRDIHGKTKHELSAKGARVVSNMR
jgi:hypothetical protein